MPTLEELTIGVVNLEMRVEKLEAWNREGGVLYNLGTKLSNLEDQHEEDRTTIYGQLTEIEETLSQDRLYAVNREREERQDRWHACRDAAVQGLLGFGGIYSWDELDVDQLLATAAKVADRAHGPLEAKAPVVETYNMTAAYVAEVNALVEAARKHVHEERDTQYAMPTDELEAALKPFEVKP